MTNTSQTIIRRFLLKIVALQLLTLMLISAASIVSNYVIKREAAYQLTSLIEGQLKQGDFREALFLFSKARTSIFDAIGYFGKDGNRIFSLPASIEPSHMDSDSFRGTLLKRALKVDVYVDEARKNKVGTMIYTFGILEFLPFAVAIWIASLLLLIPFTRRYQSLLIAEFEKESEVTRAQAIREVATQVAHDIRSPLSALTVLQNSLTELPSDKRELLVNSARRIQAIADDLLKQERESSAEKPPAAPLQDVLPVLQKIIEEKRLQHAGRDGVRIELNHEGTPKARFDSVELERVLSNLINNSVEAIKAEGTVSVFQRETANHVQLSVIDDGAGMPPEVLNRIGKRGETFGKPDGSGLGLYHAFRTVEGWGGRLSIVSKVGRGTQVTIEIPKQ